MKTLVALIMLVPIAGCSDNSLFVPPPDGGARDLGAACSSATNRASCEAIAGCQAIECGTCNGGSAFVACVPDGSPGVSCPAPCERPCSSIKHAAGCDARSDCYSLFSGDLPCDNLSCANHFVQCKDAPFVCPPLGAACAAACALLSPSCPTGYTPNQACCASGCVESTLCAACSSDAECGGHAYCRGLMTVCSRDCQLTIGTATKGTCHRSCVGNPGPCTCVDDSDCPGPFTSCDIAKGSCTSLYPPICYAQCPAGCTDQTNEQYGEICLCSSC